MKSILIKLILLTFFFSGHAFTEELVSINSNKAIAIATSYAAENMPGIKLEEYVFSQIAYVRNAKDNEVTLSVKFEKDGGRKGPFFNAQSFTVIMKPNGEVINSSTGKITTTQNSRQVIDYKLYEKKCIGGKPLIRASLRGEDLCEYGKNECGKSISREASYVAYCPEDKMSQCFYKKSWLTPNGLMGFDEKVDLKNVSITAQEICGYVKKVK